MRRLFGVVLVAVLLVSTQGGPGAAQEVAPDRADPRRGLIYDGLERRADGACGTGYALVAVRDHRGGPACTHGPDPAPPGVDVRVDGPPSPPRSAAAQDPTVPCVGNGQDGYRVQLLYVRGSDRPDSYATWLSSFRQWAVEVDDIFNASAAATGGVRHIRFVHDASCVATIDHVVLNPSAAASFDVMLSQLRGKGYDRTDRKYLVWMDANTYCGIGQVYFDDQPGQDNASNGHPLVPGAVARVDRACWGNSPNLVEAHELSHVLGAVQTSAPNATSKNHCTDEYDRLCYDDGGAGGPIRFVCPASHEARLDCNHDDYFSTNPAPGSYLATHWNMANSRFLTSSGPAPTTTLPPTTVPPTTVPPTTVPPTTVPPTTVPPTTVPPTTTTVPPTTTTTSTPTSTTVAPPPTTLPPPTVQGFTWYDDGSASKSGPAGAIVTAYATQGRPNTDYKLVTARGSCDTDVVEVNPNVRRSNSSGLIGMTSGRISRPPGSWQLCFRALDGSRVTSPVFFTVA